ncbi:Uncharacterized protein APZ42_025652 [Daphnia magna]|uniref:Uncharacterized protein n=1 Tax=Daphnia magna TaxID=35525 RepID=A0A164SVG9_9CRUS|nr:Uncharacterized protein APZ42_025652 [Daphnia magna]
MGNVYSNWLTNAPWCTKIALAAEILVCFLKQTCFPAAISLIKQQVAFVNQCEYALFASSISGSCPS